MLIQLVAASTFSELPHLLGSISPSNVVSCFRSMACSFKLPKDQLNMVSTLQQDWYASDSTSEVKGTLEKLRKLGNSQLVQFLSGFNPDIVSKYLEQCPSRLTKRNAIERVPMSRTVKKHWIIFSVLLTLLFALTAPLIYTGIQLYDHNHIVKDADEVLDHKCKCVYACNGFNPPTTEQYQVTVTDYCSIPVTTCNGKSCSTSIHLTPCGSHQETRTRTIVYIDEHLCTPQRDEMIGWLAADRCETAMIGSLVDSGDTKEMVIAECQVEVDAVEKLKKRKKPFKIAVITLSVLGGVDFLVTIISGLVLRNRIYWNC